MGSFSFKDVPRFLNSTPFEVKLSLHQDRKEELKRKTTTSHSLKAVISDLNVNVSPEYKYSGTIESENRTNFVDPDFSRFMIVHSNTYLDLECGNQEG